VARSSVVRRQYTEFCAARPYHPGYDAVEDDILDCIKNANAKNDHDHPHYYCNDWTSDPVREYGLNCPPVPLRDGWENVTLPMKWTR